MPTATMLQGKLKRLEREIDKIEKEYHPTGLQDTFKQLESKIADLRAKGYPYFKDEMEDTLEELKQLVEDRAEQLEHKVDSQIRRLGHELHQADYYTDRADLSESVLEKADKEVDDLEKKLKQAQKTIMQFLEPLPEKQERIETLLERAPYYMQMQEEASFDFNSGESVIMADKAEWVVTGKGKEDPDGILFLTNQRMIFEQKEKTGKFLGMFGGKTQHGIQWEYSLGQIASVAHEDKGMLKGKDMLTLSMQGGAEHSEIVLEVKGKDDNSLWNVVIDKVLKQGVPT